MLDNRARMCRRIARGVTEYGAVCDTSEMFGTLTSGSKRFTIQNGALTAADMGGALVAVGTASGGWRRSLNLRGVDYGFAACGADHGRSLQPGGGARDGPGAR